MHRIKHMPTGLYYQPHKHRGHTLSRKGKVYHKKIPLNLCSIVLGKGWKKPLVSKEIESWLSMDWQNIKDKYFSRRHLNISIPANISDWEYEEIESFEDGYQKASHDGSTLGILGFDEEGRLKW